MTTGRTDFWYDPRKTFSYGASLNFVLSRRGAGKTYGSLKYFCKQFLKNGRQFIYCRRNADILKSVQGTMFNELNSAGAWPGRFETRGGMVLYKKNEKSSPVVAGYLIALSLAQHYKSANFFACHYFCFDEFIDENAKYLAHEPEKLISLLETVFRMRKFQALMLANSMSWHNPYFYFFKLPTKPTTLFNDKERGIVVQEFEAGEYAKAKRQTPLAKMISGTTYGDFILDNEAVADDYGGVLKEAPPHYPKFVLTFEGVDFTFSLCHDRTAFIKEGVENATLPRVNLDKLYRDGEFNAVGQTPHVKLVKTMARQGRICFGDMKSKIALRTVLYGV